MMDVEMWRAFFAEWEAEFFAQLAPDREPAALVSAGKLTFPPASEAEIAAAEARIGQSLPPSYRAFLSVSNGCWMPCFGETGRLAPVGEIAPLNEAAPELVEMWQENDLASPTDEEYFVYGDEQDSSTLRAEYLSTAILISALGEGEGQYLLNPQVVTADDEWEAWFMADWLPGAIRYRSFAEMLQDARQSYRDLAAREALRLRAGENVLDKLPGLIGELRAQADQYRAHTDPESSLLSGVGYNEGIMAMLEEAATVVEEIREQGGPDELVKAGVRRLKAALEYQAAQRPTIEGNILALAFNFNEMADVLARFGRAEGSRQAAGIVAWFLGE